MPTEAPQVEDVFDEAIRREPGKEREGYLDEACGENIALRQRVERLLRAADQAGSFLESPAADPSPTADLPVTEQPGDTIGPYKLLQQIGEGGMGVVYMAEQFEPIERRVALKIIKPGMDTRQVIARFEAERQALAMMDHPNISKVFDAGVTETGRPYFVMELVKGTPITQYCDQHHLPPRERLELFIPVCQAIQHAHHKGIIHRDIKPSNVLVAHYDDQPVSKVIDFGVAKAIDHRLTEKTMFTEFGQVLGTFEYMSPEQARLNQWDVDTRTDVYSLGVLLYELLAGETPFDRQRLRTAAFDELLRIIREEEPPRPSTRASTSASLPTIADNRKTEPARLGAAIRGELDWIVMKTLEKDRTRRYETANGLATDLQRHLNDEPVVAGPPLARYRLAKFVKRNKLQVIAVTAVTAALVLALVGTSVGMVWALREQARADEEASRATAAAQAEAEAKVRAQKNELRAQENEKHAVEQKEIAERALARATEFKQLITEMLESVDPAEAQGADTTLLRGILDDASRRLADGEIDDELVAAELHSVVGRVYMSIGLYAEAEQHHTAAVQIAVRLLGPEDPSTLSYTHNLANAFVHLHRFDEAEELYEKTLATMSRVLGSEDLETLSIMGSLAWNYSIEGRHEEARALFEKLLEIGLSVQGDEQPVVFYAMENLARLQTMQGRYDDAEQLLQKALKLQKRVRGLNHPNTFSTMQELAYVFQLQGRLDDAADALQLVADGRSRVQGLDHPHTIFAKISLLRILMARDRGHAEGKDWDRFAAEWVSLIDRAKDTRRWHSPRKTACEEIASWPQVFRRVVELRPEETALWIGRGQYYLRRRRWQEAASDYGRAFQDRSWGDESIFEYAGVLLLTDDQQGYQRTCNEFVARSGNSHDLQTAFVAARMCGLGPASDVPNKRVVDWANHAIGEPPRPWQLHVLGLAQYRAGHYDEAIDHLEASISARWSVHLRGNQAADALNWIVLAMCHHQLGRSQQALECFDKATTLMETVTPAAGKATPLPPPDWIEWHVLLPQAVELLEIDSDDSDQSEPLDSS